MMTMMIIIMDHEDDDGGDGEGVSDGDDRNDVPGDPESTPRISSSGAVTEKRRNDDGESDGEIVNEKKTHKNQSVN